MSEGGGKGGVRKIPALMARLSKLGINIMELDVRANNPIRFITPSGSIADGYDAKILVVSQFEIGHGVHSSPFSIFVCLNYILLFILMQVQSCF